MIKRNYLKLVACLLLGVTSIISACKKNIPEERLSLASNSVFTITNYQPVLGRNTLFTDNFLVGNSSLPLNFKIINMRRFNGEAAPELNDFFPVMVWKKPYLGDEKSLAEIEAKRGIENHQLFEIREHAGQFVTWAKAKSNFIKTQPDSGYVFDVEMSNSGGRKFFRDFKYRPLRERAYEPSNLDPYTGQASSSIIIPGVNNIRGERTNRPLGDQDAQVLFKKINSTGSSLTFRFVDTLFNTIDPHKFNTTKWDEILHGFDMVLDNEKVTYKVAYPIPLIEYPTLYTNGDGSRARSIFRFDRQGFGNIKQSAQLALDFAIYEPGDWEIIFWFRTEKPKFSND
jgi:hypothetical protein